jgi:hypothetical protein
VIRTISASHALRREQPTLIGPYSHERSTIFRPVTEPETPIRNGKPPPVTSSRSTFALMFPWSPGTKNGAVPRSASVKSIVTFETVSAAPS